MTELNRLNDTDAIVIKRSLLFSEEELDLIKKVDHFTFFGRTGPVIQETLKRYYTITGVEQQLNDFVGRVGLLYILEIKNLQVYMRKHAVALKELPNG